MSVRLSPKHGVNPAIPMCFYCGEPKDEIILAGRMKDDAQAPHNVVWNCAPCDKCTDYMTKGVILISVRNGESGDNPYRTGGWCVVSDAGITHIIADEALRADILKKRASFVFDKVWDYVGLPRREHSE